MEAEEKIRLSYLDAMGIQVWSLRLPPSNVDAVDNAAAASSPEVATAKDFGSADAGVSPDRPTPLPFSDKPETRRGMNPVANVSDGVHAPAVQGKTESVYIAPQTIISTDVPTPLETKLPIPNCGWDELQAHVASCTACALHQTRTQTVFGVGERSADWMVIGEAPGEQEDLQGEPFVGRAGLLLNEMLRSIGFEREKVFIANILKCRPPKNRDPQIEEAAACEAYLKQQLALVKPKIILAVGRIAAQNLLKTTTPIGKLRGVVHDYQGVPLVVVYHPAYLLRSPLEKRRAFDDLRLALHTYRQTL